MRLRGGLNAPSPEERGREEYRDARHEPLPAEKRDAPPLEERRGGASGARKGVRPDLSPHPGGDASDGGGRSPGFRIVLLPGLPARETAV